MTADDVVEEGPRGEGGGEGGEKIKGKRHTETQHKKEGDRGKGKEVAVEKRRRHVSDTGGTDKKKQCGAGVGGTGWACVSTVKEEASARPPAGRVCVDTTTRKASVINAAGRASVRISVRKDSAVNVAGRAYASTCVRDTSAVNTAGDIGRHNRQKSQCRKCDGSSFCKCDRQRSKWKQCQRKTQWVTLLSQGERSTLHKVVYYF